MLTESPPVLERNLGGHAVSAMVEFYGKLPSISPESRPDVLIGMGYNFEYYDALFSLMMSHALFSMIDGDYTPRYRAAQFLLQPFCSEYGIEAGRPLYRTHRELYAQFYRSVVGEDMPERYPRGNDNPWLAASCLWTERMRKALMCDGQDPWRRAAYNIGYHWAVERLSLYEFTEMRNAWNKMGIHADYLDAHCSVEEEHGDWAAEAVMAFADPEHQAVRCGIRDHEDHLANYYKDLRALL